MFIVHDPTMQRHNALGGHVFPKEKLVFTQIGPLWIFGLLSRGRLGLKDIKVWDKSKLRIEGGTIHPIKEWRVGTTITMDCMRFLWRFEKFITSRVWEVAQKLGDRVKETPL